MGITTELSHDLFNIQVLGKNDIERLKMLIVDYFAAAFAGYELNRNFNVAVEKVLLSQGGKEESYVLFQNKKYPSRIAAFLNSVYGHGAELDDGNKKAAGHAGVHLIPSVFSLADKLNNKNEDVLVALATGYETYIRISSAAQPGLIERGFHSTGMAGTLACAAACSRLYHLDAQGIENAIALATTMTGGLLSYGDSRPAIKPLNPGKAAENGLFSAMLVREGVQGPTESLEGANGWFHAVTDQVDESCLKGSDHLLLHDCYIKQYPSCRHTHCGIDAAIILHEKVKPDDIQSIKVYIYPNAIKLAGIKRPRTPDETKFSIYYTLARAMLAGSYGITDMDLKHLTRDEIRIIEKTTLIPDESMENLKSGVRGTKVEVVTKKGEVITETILIPKGDPENPLTKEEIVNKLQKCANSKVDNDALGVLIDSIQEMKGNWGFKNPMSYLGVCKK